MNRVRGAVVAAALFLASETAHAQGRYASMSFSATQTYDSNLFAVPSSREPKRDLLFQFGPALEIGQRSPALTLVARYGLAAERYVDQVTLNRALARQDSSIELHHRTSRRIALDARASYLDTHASQELNLESGLVAARAHAKRFLTSSEMTYDWTRSARLKFDYTFTRDALAGGVLSTAQNGGLVLEKSSEGRRSSERLDYHIRQFDFSGHRSEIWHVVTAGWSRALSRMTTFDIALGPRLSNDTIRPEITTSLHHRLHRGELSATYSRTQATAIGEDGSLEMQRVAVGITRLLRRQMTLTARPSFMRGSRALGPVSVYAFDVEAAAHPRQGLAVVATGGLGWQKSTLGGRREEVPRRSLTIGLVATLPTKATTARRSSHDAHGEKTATKNTKATKTQAKRSS
jgi:hypothetical protein